MQTTFLSPEMTQADVLIAYEDLSDAAFNECRDWTLEKNERYLVIIKENVSVPELLSHPQIRYFRLDPNEEADLFKKIAWDFVFLKTAFIPSEKGQSVFEKLAYYQTAVHFLASEHADLGKRFIANFFANQKHIESSHAFSLLKGAFSDIPAIICGAGVSLEENADMVASLSRGAVIFSGGSALKVCSDLGIYPHFGVHFDPDPPQERYKQQSLFEIPFIWQSRLSSKLLAHVHGPKWITPGTMGYPLDENLFLGETLDAGWVVSNYAVQIAHYLGCNPIVLVGVDLCTSENRLYAKGVEQDFDGLIPCKNQNGEDRFTKPDWLLAASWFEDFAKRHPEKILYNTSSGLVIRGFLKKDLKDVLVAPLDIRAKIHVCSQQKSGPFFSQNFMAELKESLFRCEKLCRLLLQALEKAFEERSLQKGDIILLESDLEEEIAYMAIILPIWQVWKHVFARDMVSEHEFDVFVHKIVFFHRIIDIQIKESQT